MSVDLRFSNVDPPAHEPKRSIYTDLVNLPDPVYLGLTARIFNYDAVALYMRVDGYGTGWTFTTNNLGSLASGANMYRNLDNLGNRAKPAAATSETVTVRLRAYTDAAYTTLKWTFERVIDLIFIKSDDGSWTEDELDNFDDGTQQGWTYFQDVGVGFKGIVIDYVLSPPYSMRITTGTGVGQNRVGASKAFTTPNRNNVFLIVDLRNKTEGTVTEVWQKNVGIQQNSTYLIFIGRPYDVVAERYIPMDKWMRLVAPLPKNTAVTIRIVIEAYASGVNGRARLHVDDFRIISKD